MTVEEYDQLKAAISKAQRQLALKESEAKPKSNFDLLPEVVRGRLVVEYAVYLDVSQHITNDTWPYREDVDRPGIILSMARKFFAHYNFLESTYADAEREFAALVYEHLRSYTHQYLPRGEAWALTDGDRTYWRRLFKDRARWHYIRCEAKRQLALDGIDEV